ncbi:hypothetical protein LY28_02777 [Ruminiclostridium sufflavum DSM 19573]|uniref:Uncharacterized protein n=1 Tax=Ruminiclostridium sufflavum DSM 19573 TaxID=1121337 RepID=A0A318Y3Y8_9FIRM|nr:hypothetical protein [Ruminiclostridium sufflavum]PYG86751.1 hypothetical protein LY28_02777 [Ruminiclostridium sufflavum DSM 19573]
MKEHFLKIFALIWLLNFFFIMYMLIDGAKYPLNLMAEKQAYTQLIKIDGVGDIKAKRIIKQSKKISSVKDLDTRNIKYSKYFTVRSWDMRTDVMYIMFGISLGIMIFGIILFLGMLYKQGIKISVNKYIVLDSKDNKKGT